MTKEYEAISLLCDAGQNLVRGTSDLGKVLVDVCDLINENVSSFSDPEKVMLLMNRVLDASKACKMKQDETIVALMNAKELLK